VQDVRIDRTAERQPLSKRLLSKILGTCTQYAALKAAVSDPEFEQVVENLKSEWLNVGRLVCILVEKYLLEKSTYIGNAQVAGASSVSSPNSLYHWHFTSLTNYQGKYVLVHNRFTVLVSSRRIGEKGGGCEQRRYRPGTFVRPMV
jgi:hypothetical protein